MSAEFSGGVERRRITDLEVLDRLKHDVDVDLARLPLSADRRTVSVDHVRRRYYSAQRVDRQQSLAVRQKPEPDVT